MKKKALIFSLLAIVVIAGTIGILSTAEAFGGGGGWFGMRGASMTPEQITERQTEMFAHQAEMLGVSVDQVKDYWSQGMNMKEIMEELGISQEDMQIKMQAERKAQMQAQLQTLVENGVITQAQADARLQNMEAKGIGFGHKMGKRDGGGQRGGDCPFANASATSGN